jgi:hypothetical protein
MPNPDTGEWVRFEQPEIDDLHLTMTSGLDATLPDIRKKTWRVMTCDSLAEVEATLDWLENHGVKDREVVTLSDARFAVRWKCSGLLAV